MSPARPDRPPRPRSPGSTGCPTPLIDMGDFVGGMLKYLRRHPVQRVTVAGGMGKITKLGQGLLDLHSRRGEVDLDWLAGHASNVELAQRITASNSAMEAFAHADSAGID